MFKIISVAPFDKQLKRLIKKYPSLKTEFRDLIDLLELTPDAGIPLGNGCFKIRLAIESKGQGKSGGARVITYAQLIENSVYLLSIFDKSEKENISDKELKDLINMI